LSESLASHWPEYLMEAAGLGAFMISACLFGALLEHPASPVRASITDGTVRRVLGGVLMGLTAIAIIYSRWGKRSGAHINPAVTLTFLRLGKIRRPDAIFYILAQFGGGLAGVVLSAAVLGSRIADPAVNYAVTVPGPDGTRVAFIAEALISFFLMGVILTVSNSVRWNRFTGLFAGFLVATYIGLEGPLSGMSMNPARTLASALPGGVWTDFWIYFVAPPLGMLLAAEAYLRLKGAGRILCAKLHHRNEERCIFRCGFQSCGESS
jgi:aquaporin Z